MSTSVSSSKTTAEVAGRTQLKRFGDLLQRIHAEHQLQLQNSHADGSSSQQPSSLVWVESIPEEMGTIRELYRSGNLVLDKILAALTAVCKEVDLLVEEAKTKFIPALLVYGEEAAYQTAHGAGASEGMELKLMSRFLPTLQELSVYLLRVGSLVRNVVHQMSNLYNGPGATILENVHILFVWTKLGSILNVLITLDEIVARHPLIKTHWANYYKTVQLVQHNPSKFGLEPALLKPLERDILQKLDYFIMKGYIFQNCVEQQMDSREVLVTQNTTLMDEFVNCIRLLVAHWDRKYDNGNRRSNHELINVSGLYALFYAVFRVHDKRTFKQIWDTHKKVAVIDLVGDLTISPFEFLLKSVPHVDKLLDKKAAGNARSAKDQQIQALIQGILKEVELSGVVVSSWMSKMRVIFRVYTSDVNRDLDKRFELLQAGINRGLGYRDSCSVVLNWHLSENKPMSRKTAIAIFRLIEMIKDIQRGIDEVWLQIVETLIHYRSKSVGDLLRQIRSAQDAIRPDKRFETRRLDILSSLLTAEKALSGPLTNERLLVVQLALGIAEFHVRRLYCCVSWCINPVCQKMVPNQANVSSSSSSSTGTETGGVGGGSGVLDKLWHILDIGGRRSNAWLMDMSFLLWHRSLIPLYLENVIEETGNAPKRIQLMLEAMNEGSRMLAGARHADPTLVLAHFERELCDYVRENLISKLCEFVETDLRLSIHSHLQLDDRNPFINESGTYAGSSGTTGMTSGGFSTISGGGSVVRAGKDLPLKPFFNVPPLSIQRSLIHVKREVEMYLERTFYNLTSVALHDWKTYAEMRQLAAEKFGLDIAPSHLPAQTLDHGLDVLEIMRNIHVFVSRYVYNLNTQCFIEKTSKNRHLNTLTTKHVANSIRAHGTGIMNTTVNFTYQFLRKKFHIFSQFLYDDQIKSRLQKDIRFFNENQESLDGKYPVEKARKFNRGIRKLGITPDGLSYLDQFRMLISEIGNALGYIRLVRAGGLTASAEAAQFIPDLEDVVSLAPFVQKAGLSSVTKTAAENLDSVIHDLIESLTETTDYFKLLVDVFSSEFRDPKNVHLKSFYVIIPPLTINYIEHIVSAKEKVTKRFTGQSDVGCFTDDGFAMGVAYILRLLNQYEQFDALQWFSSVDLRFQAEKEEILTKKKEMGASDVKYDQTLSLSLQRLLSYRKEFKLLSFAVRSARIFFRSDPKESIPKDNSKNSVKTAETQSVMSFSGRSN